MGGAYDGLMLPEHHATSYSHDAASAKVLVAIGESPRPGLHGDVPARLLLDGANHLVGVDVVPGGPDRVVVMLGPHEKVARVLDATVHVEGGARTVTIHGHAAKEIAPGASPYVF